MVVVVVVVIVVVVVVVVIVVVVVVVAIAVAAAAGAVDVDTLKDVVDGDTLPIQLLYSEEVNMPLNFKLEASSNREPNVNGMDKGLNRRGRVLISARGFMQTRSSPRCSSLSEASRSLPYKRFK